VTETQEHVSVDPSLARGERDLGAEPLVGVLTPVFNGEKYLRECVESVLNQTYRNWEYLIVNNCSTDRTREIADSYASRDPRIRVHNNEQFVTMAENHNIGFRLLSAECKYWKVIHADDWLFPECLAHMVSIAEANPSVGVVGAYGLAGDRVAWDGLPYSRTVVSGRDMCRWYLMGGPFVLGTPTSVLYRASLMRKRLPPYRERYPHWADLDACLYLLQESDFGFVHQVLTFTRTHDEALSAFARRVNTYVFGQLELIERYGPVYLSRHEYEGRLKEILREYRRFLGQAVFKRPTDREFWEYHMSGLRDLGHPVGRAALIVAAVTAVLEVLGYPFRAARKVLARSEGDQHTFSRVRGDAST
jgi:glycosyltransferase involved in cell wall biosynthesis